MCSASSAQASTPGTCWITATTCERAPATPADDPLTLPRKAIAWGDTLPGVWWKIHVKNTPKHAIIRRAGAEIFDAEGRQTNRDIAQSDVGATQIEQFTYQAYAFLQEVAGVPASEALPRCATFADGYREMRIAAAVLIVSGLVMMKLAAQ